jgi:hypothetical protein
MISVNPFYAEYVPFERTDRCIRISRAVSGQNMMVYQPDFLRSWYNHFSIGDYAALQPNQFYERQLK